MSSSVVFWTGALLNLAVILVLGRNGILQIRRGDVARHRRSMRTAALLVVGFLVAYVCKVIWLGKEDLSVWSSGELGVLYLHETCVTLMLLSAGVALIQAWRMRGTRVVTRNPDDPVAPASLPAWHRRAGWSAALASVLGFLSAALVLYGMFGRL